VDEGIQLAEKTLGVPGLVVLDAQEAALVVDVESGKEESALSVVPQGRRSSGRSEIRLRDLRCLGRSTRLVVRKRR
jgi:hypothetical protein